jgi:hypothetical protein
VVLAKTYDIDFRSMTAYEPVRALLRTKQPEQSSHSRQCRLEGRC